MTPTNEKTADEAGTSTTAQECSQNNSVSTLYMLQRSNGTADSFGTWSGTLLPKSDFFEVIVRFSDLQAAYKNGSAEFTLNQECVIAHDGEMHRLRAEKEEQRRQAEERSARFDEELSLIKSITGMDLSRDDLPLIMLEYRRAGKDFQPFLDALQAIDDLDLQRVGLTAWEWDMDELDEEEGGNDDA